MKAKTNLKTSYFRARLFEGKRAIFVWDFGTFALFNDFYKSVKGSEVKRDDFRVEFYLCYVCDPREHLLDVITVNEKSNDILKFPHPRRMVRSAT